MMKSMYQSPVIILASRSPRRVELLSQMGLACQTQPADIDETQELNEAAEQYVVRLAKEKAQACLQRLNVEYQPYPVLAADTTVVLAGRVLGKPEDDEDARQMLTRLSGSSHLVHTAVALAFKGEVDVVLSTTVVEMMPLTAEQIAFYLETGEHRDKAGSYGIQGLAGAWIKRIEGSYTGVMGLPVFETAELLRKHRVVKF